MDRTNLDDPSAFYNLPHSSRVTPDERAAREAQERAEMWERIQAKDAAELRVYIEEHDIKGQALRLIEFFRAKGHQKSDAEDFAVSQFLKMGGAEIYRRIWRYIDADMELDAAILMAQSEVTKEADIEARATEPDGERPAKDSYLGDSLPSLMDSNMKTHGGGSRSRRRSAAEKPIVGRCENCKSPVASGVVVCQECGHEQRDRRGRKRLGDELRVVSSVRIDPETQATFKANAEIMGIWLDVCGMLIKAGINLADLQSMTDVDDVA